MESLEISYDSNPHLVWLLENKCKLSIQWLPDHKPRPWWRTRECLFRRYPLLWPTTDHPQTVNWKRK